MDEITQTPVAQAKDLRRQVTMMLEVLKQKIESRLSEFAPYTLSYKTAISESSDSKALLTISISVKKKGFNPFRKTFAKLQIIYWFRLNDELYSKTTLHGFADYYDETVMNISYEYFVAFAKNINAIDNSGLQHKQHF